MKTKYLLSDFRKCRPGIKIFHGGFSLAEVLCLLVMIGVLSVLVISPLMKKFQQSSLIKKSNAFAVKFEEGLQMMRLRNKLAKTYDTETFIGEMEKYFNIIKVCDSNSLEDCFPEKIQFKKDNYKGKIYSAANLKNAYNINEEYQSSPVYGIKFSDGTNMLISYIPDCQGASNIDMNDNTKKCFLYLYDVNAAKSPNTYGGATTGKLQNLSRDNNLNDIVGNISFPDKTYGLSFSIEEIGGNVRWDKANTYCKTIKMELPDRAKAKEIAEKIFVDSGYCTYLKKSSGGGGRYNCSEDVRSTPLWTMLMSKGSVKSGGNIDSFYFWTKEDSGGKAYDCIIGQNSAEKYYWWGCYLNSKTSNSLHIMCVD